MNDIRVFISYAQESQSHNSRVLAFANTLRHYGIDIELDRYHTHPECGWSEWCEKQLEPQNSEYVLLICTRVYKDRVNNQTKANEGRGVYWEGKLIKQYLYNEKENTRVIPITFSDSSEENIPMPLRDYTRYHVNNFNLNDTGFEGLYRHLTNQPVVTKPALGKIVNLSQEQAILPKINIRPPLSEKPVKTDFLCIPNIEISQIDRYAPTELVGREEELALLDSVWQQSTEDESNKTNILTLVAIGGEGKTSLVSRWLLDKATTEPYEFDAIFAWSFYNQGSQDNSISSADIFINQALEFFGNLDLAQSSTDNRTKGRELAKLVIQQKAIIFLDGLEPLQHPPSPAYQGELKDPGLSEFFKKLATKNPGICIITTRYSVVELKPFTKTVIEKKLDKLSEEASIKLLKNHELKGTEDEFKSLINDFDGHALSLQVIGNFIHQAFNGDIRKRYSFDFKKADETLNKGHAFRAIKAYETWLSQDEKNSKQQLAIFKIAGLFDRPFDKGCLSTLLKEPVISGLTEHLIDLEEFELNLIINNLTKTGLLTKNQNTTDELLSIDVHPLIREYFAHKLESEQLNAFKVAHARIYNYLNQITKEIQKPTLEKLQPLYQSVRHGCKARLYKDAWYVTYYDRILKGENYYTQNKLGASSTDLSVLQYFFEKPFSKIVSNQIAALEHAVYGQAGFCLKAIGRYKESENPIKSWNEITTGLINIVKNENEKLQVTLAACNSASALSSVKLILGEIDESIKTAKDAIDLSARLKNTNFYKDRHNALAHAYHYNGNYELAEKTYTKSLKNIPKNIKHLPALAGFYHCIFILDATEKLILKNFTNFKSNAPIEIQKKEIDLINSNLKKVHYKVSYALKNEITLTTIAADNLMVIILNLYEILLKAYSKESYFIDWDHINETISKLHQCGEMDQTPLGLIIRSAYYAINNQYTGEYSAQSDLDEAWEIAVRGPMRLFMADIHLNRARLFYGEEKYPWESPKKDIQEARKLIEECNYWRRKEELEQIEKAYGIEPQ